jgi:hypothetical protein
MKRPSAAAADPAAVAAETARIREDLLAKGHGRHLVCDERCRLVVEGYPRSGNTLSADLLAILSPKLRFAHHTHTVENLRLGELYKIPRVVLLRPPEDAILSFFIYADGRMSVEACVERYVAFHRGVAGLKDFVLADFSLVVEDFNAVLAVVNARLEEPIPFSDDLQRDVALARARQLERAARVHGRLAPQRAGAPDETREELKRQSRDAVLELLARDDRPAAIYETILSRG